MTMNKAWATVFQFNTLDVTEMCILVIFFLPTHRSCRRPSRALRWQLFQLCRRSLFLAPTLRIAEQFLTQVVGYIIGKVSDLLWFNSILFFIFPISISDLCDAHALAQQQNFVINQREIKWEMFRDSRFVLFEVFSFFILALLRTHIESRNCMNNFVIGDSRRVFGIKT